jgi:protein-S-isoprenylcysteine O-methyltransferase Ste14
MAAVPRRSAAPALYTLTQLGIWVVLLPWLIVSQQEVEGSLWRPFPLVAVGGMVLVAGSVIMLQAGTRLSEAGSPVFGMRPAKELVTDGWFGVIRNPQDFGTLLATFAPALAVDLRVMWVLPVIALVYYAIGIELLEDYFLLRAFGDEFEDYRRSVRKWIPRSGE